MDIQNANTQSVKQVNHTSAQTSVQVTRPKQAVETVVRENRSQQNLKVSNDVNNEQQSNKNADGQLTRGTDSVAERVLLDAIEKANSKVNGANAEYSFSVHETTKQIMIKVTDKNSGEVIKEIPSKKALDAVAMMWEFAGLMIDEKR